MGHSVTAWCKL